MNLNRRGFFKLLGLGAGAAAAAKLGAAQPSTELRTGGMMPRPGPAYYSVWDMPPKPLTMGWYSGPGGMLKHPGIDPAIYRYTEPIIIRSIDTPSRIHIIPGVTHEQVKAAVQEALEAMKNQRGLA